jgi:hypothetical protein
MAAFCLLTARGQTFTDDFNDNAFDPTKWGAATNIGAGRLFEQNQRVDFVSTSATGTENSSVRPWIGQLPVSTNWEATVQVHNALNAAGGSTNKWGSLGLQLHRPGNTNEYLYIEMYSQYGSASTTSRGIYTALQTTNETYGDFRFENLTNTDIFIKISYDADTGIVTTSYDRDAGVTALGWQPMGTFALTAAGGGGLANRNWNISSAQPFTLLLSGYSQATTIASGAIWADNFKLTILPSPPTPTIVTVADNFNDNAVDATKWGADIISGNGRLFEQNSRVDYRVTAAAPGFDEALRPWIGQLPVDVDWEATVDVHNAYNPGANQYGAAGVRLRRPGSSSEELLLEHYIAGGAGGSIGTGFFTSLQDASNFFGDTYTEFDTLDSSLKIAYTAGTKSVVVSFDRDGAATGFGWQPLGSFGLSGSGGGLANRNWGLSASQKFTLFLYGYSELAPLTGGLLWLDNFSLKSIQPPPPQLAIVRIGTNVNISWPAWAIGYTLQMKNDLGAASWTNLQTPTSPNGANFESLVAITGQNQFFRLQKL